MKQPFLIFVLFLLLLPGCTHRLPKVLPMNSIYYWRTTFCPSPAEREFVRDHQIGRIYLHMFDVDNRGNDSHNLRPEATLQFQDSLISGVEYVPTVYITQNAIRFLKGHEAEWAQKIVTRTLNMVDWHEIPNVYEMQIDGDWQTTTRKSYFLFCEELRQLLNEQGMRLSATIRISQLREPAPPVDRGVLMIYNTGSVRNVQTPNSILDIPRCKRYFSHHAIEKYSLQLDYALPTFSWAAIYNEEGEFKGLTHHMDYPEPMFEAIDSTHYRAKQYGVHNGFYFCPDEQVRVESTSAKQLRQLKSLLPFSGSESVILYHLDQYQLQRYSHEEIHSLFTR